MKNIDYLELFYKKHNLSGKISVRYSSRIVMDDYMEDVTLENGEVIGINDIIFDIDSDLPDDMFDLWLEARKENGISLPEWIQSDTHYLPKEIDGSSLEGFQKEMTILIDEIKQSMETIFKFDPGDSEEDDEDDESGDD